MGDIFGGGDQESTVKMEPWGPQAKHLKRIFDEAKRIYDERSQEGFFGGDLYAGLNDTQRQALQQAIQLSQGAGSQLAQNAMQQANLGMSAGQGFLSNAQGIYNMLQNPQQSLLNTTAMFANNPYLDAQIDAANRDVQRQLTEQVLPGIATHAAATGNTNSSRTGVAEGIALRGAQDRMADTAAQMRSDAYNRGMQMASNTLGQQIQGQLGANQQLGDAWRQGMSGANTALALAQGNIESMLNAGGIQQMDEQARLNEAYQRWLGQDQRQQSLLNDYYNIIGSGNWGGTQTTTQSGGKGGGLFGNLLGTGLVIGSGFMGGPAGGMSALGVPIGTVMPATDPGITWNGPRVA